VSKRTYMVRRAVALAIVLVLAYAIVSGVSSLFGSDSEATAPSTPVTQTVVNDGSPTTLGTLPPTTTTQPPVKARTTPTKDDPAEVLILGDSDAGSFGPYLKTLLDQTGIATTELDYKTSSGLARPDFFDWPAHMREVVPQFNPDIVVVTFGGNDAQGLRNADKTWAVNHAPASGGDDKDWRTEYAKRVGAVMDYLTEGNRTLVWVGIPNDNNPDVTARMKVQDVVVRSQAARRSDKVTFVDTWDRFSGRNGGWAEYVIDPRDGEGKDVRADDGFHLNTTGAEILALDIAEAVKADLRARGAKI
jgi:hypothetical protein